MKLRRWGIRFVGIESGAVNTVPWLRFWRKQTAERTASKLTNLGFEELVRAEVYRR
jgi:hypothetical protein